ncbi:MAG TPA: LLM class flavin-dependent oxidoreductase [Solirubrobacteraceae bacterium]|jgi:alkanesulfonate monooxygenase SsuD/methylene tetrahydromethanopterin reductase-like flavin-dependent oxidoreductase (luciferase family)|nr:LLM class flavin-dependent oxidoreductase [Solirubrobacteraceae bacterium]
MRHGLYVAPFGELSDVRALAAIAAEAETSGWDGLFVWDHVMTFDGLAVADPWIALTAVALATERLRLGAMVTPLARRRPWDVARQVAVLDHLSRGRMVFGAGLGGDSRRELSAFGEERDPRARAALLDEALELVVELWGGEDVTRAGGAFALDRALVRPAPLQQPRPPVWLGCVWPNRRPLVRAARYDGAFPVSHTATLTADDVRSLLEIVAEHRPQDAGSFDVVLVNHERPDPERIAALGAAGATWWLQGFGERPRPADVRDAAAAGPPQ